MMTRCKGRIHRYRRITNVNGKSQWKCLDCPSYTYNPYDLLGSRARCFYCGNLYTIVPDTLRYVHLKCGTNLDQCRENIAGLVEVAPGGIKLVQGSLDPEKFLDAEMTASVRRAIGDSRSESEQEPDVDPSEASLLSDLVKQAKTS